MILENGEAGPQMEVEGEQVAIEADGVGGGLAGADSVVIIPGYGLAVAQAQQAVSERPSDYVPKGKRFVLPFTLQVVCRSHEQNFAEAKVPYDIVLEMDEINDDFPETDVSIVIGSNDIVNFCWCTIQTAPLRDAGARVLEVKTGLCFKRYRHYSGIETRCSSENTRMLYGDAKASLDKLRA